MDRTLSSLEEIKLVGIKVRTCNHDELEMNTAKIMPCVQKYFIQQISQDIPNRTNHGVTYCAYTDYESDYTGKYTFFIGEEVSAFDDHISKLDTLVIPKQKYIKFTTETGIMPDIVIDSWNKIWQMSSQDLGGIRSYRTDFEIYDKRALDPQNSVLDIYIGIN